MFSFVHFMTITLNIVNTFMDLVTLMGFSSGGEAESNLDSTKLNGKLYSGITKSESSGFIYK